MTTGKHSGKLLVAHLVSYFGRVGQGGWKIGEWAGVLDIGEGVGSVVRRRGGGGVVDL